MSNGPSDSDRVVELLEELVVWTKAGLYSNVAALIADQFGDARSEQRLAFHLCEDHTYGRIVEICRATLDDPRVSTSSISNWVERWENVGLLSRNGRTVQKHFALDDFGVDLPDPVVPDEGD